MSALYACLDRWCQHATAAIASLQAAVQTCCFLKADVTPSRPDERQKLATCSMLCAFEQRAYRRVRSSSVCACQDWH